MTGLTASDISRLDTFEGGEYTRQKVSIRLLQAEGDEKNSSGEEGNVKTAKGEQEEKENHLLPCETYIWTSHPSRLEDREWDFAEFVREKQHKWVGSAGQAEYAEVDELVAAAAAAATERNVDDGTGGRGSGGYIADALLEEQKKKKKDLS